MRKVIIAHQNSQTRRELYSKIKSNKQIEVQELVSQPSKIFEAIENQKPDVLLLGIKFDKISGLDILNHIMRTSPTPTLMIGDETGRHKEEAVKAFSYGAVDFISTTQPDEEINKLIEMAAGAQVKRLVRQTEHKIETPDFSDKILVIGSSTGGPPEIEKILKTINQDFPAPIVIAQHMGSEFTPLFAKRLNKLTSLEVKEAENHEELEKGKVLIGPGDKDVEIKKSENKFYIETHPPQKGNNPSVDRLLESASKTYGANTVSVILSGMGDDGAIGASYVKSEGGKVIVQDEETSKVYGMPKQVKKQGHADEQKSLEKIPETIARCI